ncbi:Zinc transporter ZIP13 homolog [Gryllus bimaculatus]|nr:Zinc transporter ZIP13 homolog [Gryllus bimaculatus]
MCSVIGADMDFTLCQQNVSTEHSSWLDYKPTVEEYLPADLFTSVYSMLPIFEYHPWVFSLIGSTLIGLSGVFPLLVIPIQEEENFDINGTQHVLLLETRRRRKLRSWSTKMPPIFQGRHIGIRDDFFARRHSYAECGLRFLFKGSTVEVEMGDPIVTSLNDRQICGFFLAQAREEEN